MKLNKVTMDSVTSTIGDLTFIKDILKSASETIAYTEREHICKRYIEVQNVAIIAKELNNDGIRINGRKYIGKDISNIISTTSGAIGAIAKSFHRFNNTLQNGTRSFSTLLKELKAIGEVK